MAALAVVLVGVVCDEVAACWVATLDTREAGARSGEVEREAAATLAAVGREEVVAAGCEAAVARQAAT